MSYGAASWDATLVADTAREPEAQTASEVEDVDPTAEGTETTGPGRAILIASDH